MARHRYLPEEHGLILVNNNFGEQVEKTYKNFGRNTSVFTPDAEALQGAVSMNNHTDHNQCGNGRGQSLKDRKVYPEVLQC